MSRPRFALALLALLVLCGFPREARAHNADIATFVIHRGPTGVWVVETHLSTVGLNRALERRTGKRASELGPEVYRAQAVTELREGLTLVVDGQVLTLGKAGVRLGSHDSSVFFGLPDAPAEISELWGSQVSALSGVDNQHNVLRLVTAEGPRQWVLAERSGFTLTRPAADSTSSSPSVVAPVSSPNSLGWAWVLLALAGGIGVAVLAPRKTSRSVRESLV